MKLYAIFKDGILYRASYKQNVPFYETEIGAKRALQNATSERNALFGASNMSPIEKQEYLEKLRSRFDIREFELLEIGTLDYTKREK